jgi:hypothetical protein
MILAPIVIVNLYRMNTSHVDRSKDCFTDIQAQKHLLGMLMRQYRTGTHEFTRDDIVEELIQLFHVRTRQSCRLSLF